MELRSEAELRAVEAYINPDTEGDNGEIVAAENLAEAARRQAFLSTVTSRKTDVLDRIRATEEDMVVAEGDAVAAREQEERENRRVERLLDEYNASLAQQQEAQSALQTRIADFEAEVDALAAEEARLTALIRAQASQAPVVPAGETPAPNAVETPSGPVNPPSSGSGMIWPTSGAVTSEFGPRWGRLHAGHRHRRRHRHAHLRRPVGHGHRWLWLGLRQLHPHRSRWRPGHAVRPHELGVRERWLGLQGPERGHHGLHRFVHRPPPALRDPGQRLGAEPPQLPPLIVP